MDILATRGLLPIRVQQQRYGGARPPAHMLKRQVFGQSPNFRQLLVARAMLCAAEADKVQYWTPTLTGVNPSPCHLPWPTSA